MRRFSIFAVCAALFLSLLLTESAVAAAQEVETEFTVLFTHDLHSHLLPALDENGNSYGGYARLMTAVREQKALHPDALFVDGGDFSAGSLFQTSYRTSAVELRVMSCLGVDVTTFGNHEYDDGPQGLADMLGAAVDSGDDLPAIVETNYLPEGDGDGMEAVRDAFARYGVERYVLLERGGVWFAVFSSYGVNADEYAPTSGMTLIDRFSSAAETAEEAVRTCTELHGVKPVVVCISHAGTSGGEGEDYELAEKVGGIDLIVSGHTHTTLSSPILVNGTYIVSCGAYAKNLGSITLSRDGSGRLSLVSYTLTAIDDGVAPDAEMTGIVDRYKKEVERDYLSKFGVTFDQVLVDNPYPFESQSSVGRTLHESPLCSLFADAYKWAAEKSLGEPIDVALTADGVIRASLPTGSITVSDVFTAASLGTGKSDLPGGTLLSLWLTGSDLKNLLEVDASVQSIMKEAQLFCSGIEYTINTKRMFFNRVESAMLVRPDGRREPIENGRLYHIVTGSYAGNMLGTVGRKSFGLLNITPRDRNGDPLDPTRLTDAAITGENGIELKEWYAIAEYLTSMDGKMDAAYAQPDGRKTVHASLAPTALLRNANRFTFAVILIGILLLAVILLIVRGIVRRSRKKRAR